MPDQKATPRKQLPVRMPPDTWEQLRGFADFYGRSLNSEVELAVEAHIHAHALAMLRLPEVRKERGAAWVNAERRKTEQALAELYERAFSRRAPTELLAEREGAPT